MRRALNLAFDFEELNRTIFFGQYQRVNLLLRSELASSGLPTGKELAILEEVRDKVPPSRLHRGIQEPGRRRPQASRDNLRQAIALFKEAGWCSRATAWSTRRPASPSP